jgi:hypothetical protein
MITIDDLAPAAIPAVLPLDITPRWQQLLFGRPYWRFRHGKTWIYVTANQYSRIFRRS